MRNADDSKMINWQNSDIKLTHSNDQYMKAHDTNVHNTYNSDVKIHTKLSVSMTAKQGTSHTLVTHNEQSVSMTAKQGTSHTLVTHNEQTTDVMANKQQLQQ